MNHDFTHCADYSSGCPKKCFRAKLTEELELRSDLIGLTFSWAHFKNTDECPRWPRKVGNK